MWKAGNKGQQEEHKEETEKNHRQKAPLCQVSLKEVDHQ